MKRFVCAAAATVGLLGAGAGSAQSLTGSGTFYRNVYSNPSSSGTVPLNTPFTFNLTFSPTEPFPGANYTSAFTINAPSLGFSGSDVVYGYGSAQRDSYADFLFQAGRNGSDAEIIQGSIFLPTSAVTIPGTIGVLPTSTLQLFIRYGEFDGVISTISDANLGPAVPEPATWALALLGFGVAGAALRRRPRPVLA